MPLSSGDQLGHYKILSMIGKGGMGEVYRARDTTLKREVALKVLPADLSTNPERTARFQREAEVLASLDHPNIAHIHGIVDAEGPGATRAGAWLALDTRVLRGDAHATQRLRTLRVASRRSRKASPPHLTG